jgi:VWFA-related protein
MTKIMFHRGPRFYIRLRPIVSGRAEPRRIRARNDGRIIRAMPVLLLILALAGFDFALEFSEEKITLAVPVDQLKFVDDGTAQVAQFSARVLADGKVVRVLAESRKVIVPHGREPQGAVRLRFDLLDVKPEAVVMFVVVDEIAGTTATRMKDEVSEAPAADATWRDARARAQQRKKPLVVFFKARPCARCRSFEEEALPHPTVQRRMPNVEFAVLPAYAGEAAKVWASKDSGVALFDTSGTLRTRWPIVPDTTNLGIILDAAVEVFPHFERGTDLELAYGLAKLGRITEARVALERAGTSTDPEVQQGVAALRDVLNGKAVAAPASQGSVRGVIRIIPLSRQVVSGKQIVRLHVSSASVARVTFAIDGRERARVAKPPFAATLDFGAVPERHSIRVTAFDRNGKELGRDERVVNEAGETFWLRVTSPREAFADGSVQVSMDVRAPSTRRVQRVVVSWNDAERAVLKKAPWETRVHIPSGQLGVLRAVAELDDGRTSEDAVLLNAGGMVEHSNVQLVQLPITIAGAAGTLTPERITVREGTKVRPVESIATAAETPVTIGLAIDVSGSMQKNLPDLQEAAIRFLETSLGERDRAFIITFDDRARLLQPATSDVAQLRRQIMSIRPNGATALHDAMVLGLLQFEGVKGRRAMIVFTDGLDRTSQYTAADVRELARRSSVPIHVFAAVPWSPALNVSGWISDRADADGELKRLAKSTGGTAHTLQALSELPAAYARIETALRSQLLAFIRTDPATKENEWRPIHVEVRGANVDVFAPEGYYASW